MTKRVRDGQKSACLIDDYRLVIQQSGELIVSRKRVEIQRSRKSWFEALGVISNTRLVSRVHYEPRPDCKDWVNMLCEGHAEDKAICAYLSPIDAMLEVIVSSKPGRRFEVSTFASLSPAYSSVTIKGGLRSTFIWAGLPGTGNSSLGLTASRCHAPHITRCKSRLQAGHIAFTLQADTLEALDRL